MLWAPVNLMVHTAAAGGLSIAAIGLLRWGVFGGLLFGALATPGFRRATRAVWPSAGDALKMVLVGTVFFAPAHVLYYYSLGKGLTSTVEGTVLNTTGPLCTAIFAFFLLRERIGSRRWFAIFIGLVGAYIVSVGFGPPHLDSGHTLGNALYFLGVLSESLVVVVAIPVILRTSGITVLAFQIVGAVITYTLVPVLLGRDMPLQISHVTPAAIGAMAYLALLPGFLAFSVWYMTAERAPISLMVLSTLLQPPLSALLAWRVLGESLRPELFIGSLGILAGLLIAVSGRSLAVLHVPDAEGDQGEHGGYDQDPRGIDLVIDDEAFEESP